jgi:solute carrier family 27 fatty acid transporter 2/solute carrier family 27 fatty acid transporter 6
LRHNGPLTIYIFCLQSDKDKDHYVRLAIGNGLRQDIFAEFKERFGIPTIAEFYASTEGVAGFANVSNVIGSCGRSSPLLVGRNFIYSFMQVCK